MNQTIARFDDVTMRFAQISALQNVSVTLAPGKVVALVGHNGAGKTTFLKLLLGLLRPTSGSVAVLGADPAGRNASILRRRIGFLPETVTFHGAMTGRELICFFAGLKGVPAAAAVELLSQVNLEDAGSRRVGTYSKGMRQRLGMAQALLGDPELLLLDEPTSGLDPHSRHRMYETIDALRAQGKTVLASTHALAEIESHADEVILIHGGRVLAAGTLTELRGTAALPTMAKVRLRHDAAHSMPCIDANGIEMSRPAPDRLDFRIPAGHLPSFLDILATSRSWIEDIEIEPPTLDRLYQHLLAQAEADQ
jgi:Cu-processing system ATP-binding protein